jgi:hypothetical protein
MISCVILILWSDTLHQANHSKEYFNGRRPHQGINGKTPTKVIQLESRQTLIPAIRYCKTPEVDGFITSFKRTA